MLIAQMFIYLIFGSNKTSIVYIDYILNIDNKIETFIRNLLK